MPWMLWFMVMSYWFPAMKPSAMIIPFPKSNPRVAQAMDHDGDHAA